jgi:hypothetical protein
MRVNVAVEIQIDGVFSIDELALRALPHSIIVEPPVLLDFYGFSDDGQRYYGTYFGRSNGYALR